MVQGRDTDERVCGRGSSADADNQKEPSVRESCPASDSNGSDVPEAQTDAQKNLQEGIQPACDHTEITEGDCQSGGEEAY